MIIQQILCDDLIKRKLCARFVPHALTREQREHRVSYSEDILQMISYQPDFLDKVVTGDEMWCFAYDPLTKRQSAEWVGEEELRLKKLKFQKSIRCL